MVGAELNAGRGHGHGEPAGSNDAPGFAERVPGGAHRAPGDVNRAPMCTPRAPVSTTRAPNPRPERRPPGPGCRTAGPARRSQRSEPRWPPSEGRNPGRDRRAPRSMCRYPRFRRRRTGSVPRPSGRAGPGARAGEGLRGAAGTGATAECPRPETAGTLPSSGHRVPAHRSPGTFRVPLRSVAVRVTHGPLSGYARGARGRDPNIRACSSRRHVLARPFHPGPLPAAREDAMQ